MVKYRIFETDNFLDNLEELKKAGARKIVEKLREFVYPHLHKEPHYGPNIRKLRNWESETWRYRIGSWRFFYEINESEKIVYMIAAYHRKEAYR